MFITLGGDIIKTGQKVKSCKCVQCIKKISLTFFDNTIQTEGLAVFLLNAEEILLKQVKIWLQKF